MDTQNVKYILGIGNPIIDISATTDEETIKKFGLEFGKTVFANDSNIGFYDYLEAQNDVTLIPGGSVTNSIRITNWLLNGNKHYRCIILGCIGKDAYGQRLSSELEKSNVKPLLEISEDQLTSRCGVAVHLKERCLVPQIRASTHLSPEFVQKNIDVISQSEILLIEGYFVIEKYNIVLDLIKHFTEIKKTIAFTLSATFMVQAFYDRMLEVSNQSHIIFCNHEEAQLFSKINSENWDEISVAIHKILKPLDRILVITCGVDPVVISRFDYETNALDFILKSSCKLIKEEEIVDTNGCGDAFVGGFLSQYIQGKSLEKCARAGIWGAQTILKNVGCTYADNFQIPEFN